MHALSCLTVEESLSEDSSLFESPLSFSFSSETEADCCASYFTTKADVEDEPTTLRGSEEDEEEEERDTRLMVSPGGADEETNDGEEEEEDVAAVE